MRMLLAAVQSAETKADIAACNKLGEEDALERTGTPRADTMPRGGPMHC